MTVNPYQSPDDLPASRLGFDDPQDLGELIAEYRVSRVVAWAFLSLMVGVVGLCMLVMFETFTSNYDSIRKQLTGFAALSLVATASGLAAAAARGARLAVFERGIFYSNAIQSTEFRYSEVSDMYVSTNPLKHLGKTINPLKPHLVISVSSPVQKRHYLSPFLITKYELFERAVRTWRAASRDRRVANPSIN